MNILNGFHFELNETAFIIILKCDRSNAFKNEYMAAFNIHLPE